MDSLYFIWRSFISNTFVLQTGTKLATVSEAEVRAAFTARLGMPLTGQMLPGTLPFYPSLTVIDGETGTGYVHKQMGNMDHPSVTNRQQHPSVYHGAGAPSAPITDTQVAHARLQKAGHRPLGSMFSLSCLVTYPRRACRVVERSLGEGPLCALTARVAAVAEPRWDRFWPSARASQFLYHSPRTVMCLAINVSLVLLGRTQSAPLPLGHPMLQGGMMAPQTHYEEYLAEKQLHDQQQAHNYLKQQIRQTVLTRVGSRGQANQLDEAPETEESEVIDLTGGKKDLSEESEISKQQRDREQFLQQQRDLMMRHTLQVSNESTAYSGTGNRSSQPCARPLSRALSSPLVHLGKAIGRCPARRRVRSLRILIQSSGIVSREWENVLHALPLRRSAGNRRR